MKKHRILATALAAALAVGAISGLHAQPAAAPAPAQAWKVDAVHSHVTFTISHFGISKQEGRFNDVSGTIHFDPANLAGSKIDVTVDIASIDTNNEMRDKHLRTEDYFNADVNKTAQFVSTKIEPGADDKTFKVTGDLKFMGQSKPLTATFNWGGIGSDPRAGTRTAGDATFTLNRPEWGVGKPGGGLGDEVTVRVAIEATKDEGEKAEKKG